MDNQKLKAALINTIKSGIRNHYDPEFDVMFSDDKLSTYVTDHVVIMRHSADSEGEVKLTVKANVREVIKVRIKKKKTTDAAKGGVGGAVIGVLGGSGAGAGIGALIGIAGGPIGIALGLGVGAGVGATLGVVAGGTSGAGLGYHITRREKWKMSELLPKLGEMSGTQGDHVMATVTV